MPTPPGDDDPTPPRTVYDEHAAAFDEDTGLEELPASFRELLASFAGRLPGTRVLDAGCGPGRDVAYFHDRGLDPVGVDAARGMVAYAHADAPGRFLQMDVRRLGFPDGCFDGVWSPATLCFLPPAGMETALAEFARVLRPGGVPRVGFKVGDGRIEVEKWGETTVEYHVPEERARTLLEDAGFDVSDVRVNRVSPERTFANVGGRLPE